MRKVGKRKCGAQVAPTAGQFRAIIPLKGEREESAEADSFSSVDLLP